MERTEPEKRKRDPQACGAQGTWRGNRGTSPAVVQGGGGPRGGRRGDTRVRDRQSHRACGRKAGRPAPQMLLWRRRLDADGRCRGVVERRARRAAPRRARRTSRGGARVLRREVSLTCALGEARAGGWCGARPAEPPPAERDAQAEVLLVSFDAT